MPNLFDYTHLNVSLERKTKSAEVTILTKSTKFNPFQFISELENLYSYFSNKLEVNSIYIEFEENQNLINKDVLKNCDHKRFIDFCHKVQEITWIQLLMPQTIIWDLGNVSDYHFWELSFGADIRLCNEDINIEMNLLERGLCPLFSGTSMTSYLFNYSKIKAHLSTGLELNFSEITELGMCHFKNSFGLKKSLLTKIAKQSSVTRIQYKRSINNMLIKKMEELMNEDREFSHAALASGDWSRYAKDENFMNPKEMGRILKEQKQESAGNAGNKEKEELIA